MKRLLVLLAFLILAPAAYAAFPSPDDQLSPVAAAVSGVPEAKAFCGGTVYGAWGDVLLDPDGKPIPNEYLAPVLCTYLHRFQEGWRPRPACLRRPPRCSVGYLALAALVVTHESIHVGGDTDEATTECSAIQRVRRTFALLGEPGDVAGYVRYALWWHRQEIQIWSLQTGTRPYFSPDCRPDGALDESPGDGVWP